jgi:hypothetical protein
MGEHPVRIQPKMVMAFPPGRGHRIGLVNHELIKTSPSDRPGSRQTSRASTHDHNMLIHDASVDPFPLTVNRRRPPPAGPPADFPGPAERQMRIFAPRGVMYKYTEQAIIK